MPKDQEDEVAHELTKLSDQLIGIAQSTLTLAMQLKLSSSPSAPSKIEKSGVLTQGDSTVSLTQTVSTTMLYDTESLDILTDFTHGQPARGKECRRTVGKSAQKTPFRFRILRLMAAASWPNEKDFSIARAIVEEMNADLKDPATSMKKRMKQRDFYLVDETKDMITWRHPKLSAHTWKRMVGTLR